jgi:hypothetical protein
MREQFNEITFGIRDRHQDRNLQVNDLEVSKGVFGLATQSPTVWRLLVKQRWEWLTLYAQDLRFYLREQVTAPRPRCW